MVGASAPQRRTHLPDVGIKRAAAGMRLGSRASPFSLHASRGAITVRTRDDPTEHELLLSLVVNGNPRPLAIGPQDLRAVEKDSFGAAIPLSLGVEEAGALFDVRVDPVTSALVIELRMVPKTPLLSAHTIALRVDTPTRGRPTFVSGTGKLADLGTATGTMAVLDSPPRPFGFTSTRGPLDISTVADDGSQDASAPMHLAITSAEATFDGTKDARAELRVVVGTSSGDVWRSMFKSSEVATQKVRGIVTGTGERAHVFGLDGEGLPRVYVGTDESGRFEVDVPSSVTQWYAALDPTRTSAPISFPPGTPWDLKLDVSPGGELAVDVTDADTGAPVTARLLVHGIDGTMDPSFGPDYRASGAGPIIDSLRGQVWTPLPAGRYRVAATKGIEWSIDAKTIDIVSGRSASAELVLRHVVSTPGVVGCDLHVHARPSFDTPVSPEDRVLSLVAAGIDFAVPSEHNLVGDYGPALDALNLANQLAFVTGVEITTYNPRLGHFGVFPYPPGPTPPYRGTSATAVFAAARRGDPNRVLVVHHPRLPQAIGYFEIFQYSPDAAMPPSRMRTDFDAIEVYNGYDASRVQRVDAVLRDFYSLLNLGRRYAATGSSDSHRIQFQWAGYPRTMVSVGESAAGDTGRAIDTSTVVAAIKRGRAIVTSGPIFDVDVRGAHPGEETDISGDAITAHVTVRAAPWIDVSSLEFVVGGREALKIPIPTRPTQLGPEPGTREEAALRTVRYDAEVSVPIGADSTWLIVIARGSRAMDDILPFMPVTPLAFTNPIWLNRPGRPMPKPAPTRRPSPNAPH